MGLKEIEREILETGQKEVDRINREAGQDLGKLEKEINEKTSSEARKLEEKRMKEMELDRKRILAKSNLLIKEQVEKKKDEMIERVFEESSARVLKMGNAEKKRILKKLMEEASEGLEKPTTFVDRKYARLLKGARGSDLGDFGVRVTSGHITVDNTLSAKLKEIKSNSRHKVADVLWQS